MLRISSKEPVERKAPAESRTEISRLQQRESKYNIYDGWYRYRPEADDLKVETRGAPDES